MKLFWKLLSASIRSRMQYKLNFLLSMTANALLHVLDYVMLAAILLRFDNVKGWEIEEIGFLYGISSIAVSLYRTFAPEIHNFEKYMVHGEFDSLLIRPISPFLFLLTRNVNLSHLGGVIQGLLILTVSAVQLDISLPLFVALCLYLPVAVMSSFIIALALGVVTATIGFWTQKIKDLQAFTLYAPFNAANFPLTIYPTWLKFIFFTVLPIAFMNYLPMTYLLNKGGQFYYIFVTPCVSFLFFGLAYHFWSFGIRFYHSTGS
ncbi:ABC-2 family transporter protein [Hazenella sp. IB182357]|uniref:ABC-2 family transporter protein n=1 Tax=Polycladospora coralii TaxID=2771432 RepID=A0A926NAT6_9BACL|nr:ABC-2 family transporter protein [Polycladospora coralii]MBD1372220.1 ABC-2 family transporter protein [Polycladospora coralii]MBS7530719.1 ABC-2 family transporter protein [Polycladospora coralii]